MSAGGAWGPIGLFPVPVCRPPTKDADRICGDDNECESRCLAELTRTQLDLAWKGEKIPTLGRCAPVRPVLGCLAIVFSASTRLVFYTPTDSDRSS